MVKTSDGGPAFPSRHDVWVDDPPGTPPQMAGGTWETRTCPGMSLRAWLAGQALASFDGQVYYEKSMAEMAVLVADETLKALGLVPEDQPGEEEEKVD